MDSAHDSEAADVGGVARVGGTIFGTYSTSTSRGITITAQAVGSEIVLLVDRPTGRSMLIGSVRTDR